MPYTTLLIDLDETVYPSTCGIWDAISKRMEQYMHERLGLDLVSIPTLRTELYQQYGTTLRGLQMKYQVDERDFIDFVHHVPLDELLQPDPELREALLQLPQRRLIFTNADHNHAERVTRRLGIDGLFERVIDIYDISPYCKPMPEAFAVALQLAGEADPGKCVFIDDSPRNLSAARALGFFTVQVGRPKPGFQHPQSGAHLCIDRLSELPRALENL